MTFYNFENMSLKAANEILNAHADSVVRFLDMPEGGERTALHKQLYAVLYGPAMVLGEYFAGEDNMDKGHDLLNQILDGASKYMPSKRSLSGFFGDCLKRRKIDAVRQKARRRKHLKGGYTIHRSQINIHNNRSAELGAATVEKILMKATANFTSKADVKISEVIIRQLRENGAVSTRKEIAKEAGYSAPQVTQRMAVIEKKVAEQFRQEGFDMGA